MESSQKTKITVETTVKVPVDKVWIYWNAPEHITKWCHASDDWHSPYADNDLKVNGTFKTTMAAKDGSFSFDFGGVYTTVQKYKLIEYTMDDGRMVSISFSGNDDETKITETFEAETMNSIEMQKNGWQAILNNFKTYTETN